MKTLKKWWKQRYKEFDPRKGEQPIVTGYIGAVLAITFPIYLAFEGYPSFDWMKEKMIQWLFVYGFFLCLLDYGIRRKELLPLRKKHPLPFPVALKGALVRYTGWWILLLLGFSFYSLLNLYRDPYYKWFIVFYKHILLAWGIFGFPLLFFSLRHRYGRKWDLKDPSIFTILILLRFYREIRRKSFSLRWVIPFFHPLSRRMVWLGLIVKGFFLPLMTTFMMGNGQNFIIAIQNLRFQLQTIDPFGAGFYRTATYLYELFYQGFYFMDVSLAVIGYAVTTRLLNNGTRRVEYTGIGWWVCILCYPPFNGNLTSLYFPWPSYTLHALPDNPLKIALMIAILFFLWIYVWATMAFGVRFSNLTHRGIVTQGPYRWIRHPAYISKNLSWWLEYLPGIVSFSQAFYLFAWNLIYFLRAITEERLLSADPAYRKYCEEVRWRFIPKIF